MNRSELNRHLLEKLFWTHTHPDLRACYPGHVRLHAAVLAQLFYDALFGSDKVSAEAQRALTQPALPSAHALDLDMAYLQRLCRELLQGMGGRRSAA